MSHIIKKAQEVRKEEDINPLILCFWGYPPIKSTLVNILPGGNKHQSHFQSINPSSSRPFPIPSPSRFSTPTCQTTCYKTSSAQPQHRLSLQHSRTLRFTKQAVAWEADSDTPSLSFVQLSLRALPHQR